MKPQFAKLGLKKMLSVLHAFLSPKMRTSVATIKVTETHAPNFYIILILWFYIIHANFQFPKSWEKRLLVMGENNVTLCLYFARQNLPDFHKMEPSGVIADMIVTWPFFLPQETKKYHNNSYNKLGLSCAKLSTAWATYQFMLRLLSTLNCA